MNLTRIVMCHGSATKVKKLFPCNVFINVGNSVGESRRVQAAIGHGWTTGHI